MEGRGEPRELELRDYFAVLRRRKWVVAGTALIVVLAVFAFSLTQQKMYRATTEVLLQPRASEQIFQPTQQQDVTPDTTRVATEIQVMQSRSVQDAVAQQLGHRVNVDISAQGQTDVVAISAEDHDPSQAAHIAQTYAETYVTVRRDQAVQDLLAASTQIQQQIDRINGQISDLNNNVNSLNSQITAATTDAERQRLSQQRDQLQQQNASQIAALQSRIASYTAQLDNLQVASNLTQTGGAQIVSAAQVPTAPVSPTPKRNAVVALFVGLLLGIGLAFLREYLDDTIKSKEDIDAVLGVPVLGLVPHVDEWKNTEQPELISVRHPKSPASEAYRTLRTSVQFVGIEHQMKLIQVTSPAVSEGKTTTLANLGVAMARAGSRVVMVDCDLRRPRVESFFGLPNDVGLTNVVVGDVSLIDAIQRVPDEPRLAVLPAGPPPPNPSELLNVKRTADLLRALGDEADYVLVDSPPILPVTDAIIISGIVDATMVVVTANTTTKRQAQRALELLQQIDAPVVGVVFNGVQGGRGAGYNAYGYYASTPSRRKGGLFGRRRAKNKQHAARPEVEAEVTTAP